MQFHFIRIETIWPIIAYNMDERQLKIQIISIGLEIVLNIIVFNAKKCCIAKTTYFHLQVRQMDQVVFLPRGSFFCSSLSVKLHFEQIVVDPVYHHEKGPEPDRR